MATTRLSDHCYLLDLAGFQAYAHVADGALTLVDTGGPGTLGLLLDRLGAITPDPRGALRLIVLTHHHDDHMGNAAELRAMTGCDVIAHAADASVIAGARPGTPPDFQDWEVELHRQVAAGLTTADRCVVDQTVDHGAVVPALGGARVISTPSHTDGSMGLLLAEEGVLFSGDALATNQGQVMPGVFNVRPAGLSRDVTALGVPDYDVLAVGHGAPVTVGAAAAVRELAERVSRAGDDGEAAAG